jgi:hypothetical protein
MPHPNKVWIDEGKPVPGGRKPLKATLRVRDQRTRKSTRESEEEEDQSEDEAEGTLYSGKRGEQEAIRSFNRKVRNMDPPKPYDGQLYDSINGSEVDPSFFYMPRDAPLIRRGHMDRRAKWDGDLLNFQQAYMALYSWALGTGMAYMFDKQFLAAYAEHGWGEARNNTDQAISTAQFRVDQEALYGAIMGSFNGSQVGQRYLIKWGQPSGNGPPNEPMVLYDCLQDFNSDRNKQHKIVKLSETINQAMFTKNYPGGLRGK